MITSKNYQFHELGEHEIFEPSTIAEYVPFTQAKFYGDWQKFLKRKVRRFIVKKDELVVAYFQLIKYPLIAGRSYLYIPYGPVTKDYSLEFLQELKSEILKICKNENAVFARLDFTPVSEQKIISKLFSKAPKYTYHSAYFQPRYEWFLDIQKNEEQLLKEMEDNTRYSIKFSSRKEIVTEIITQDFYRYLEPFYELMIVTSKRNGFSLHPKAYYEAIFRNLKSENGFLAVARFGEKILAIDFFVVYADISNYVFACSSNEERNKRPTYNAIWKSICHSKSLGCKFFSFGGISSSNNIYKGWEGLTAFKKQFGGQEIVHSEFYDAINNKIIYTLYNLRKFILKKILRK